MIWLQLGGNLSRRWKETLALQPLTAATTNCPQGWLCALANHDFQVWVVFLPSPEMGGNLITPRDQGNFQDSWKMVWLWMCPFPCLACSPPHLWRWGSMAAAILLQVGICPSIQHPQIDLNRKVTGKLPATVFLVKLPCVSFPSPQTN